MGRGDLRKMMRLAIPRDQVAEMRDHIEKCLPQEACGLLAGRTGSVQKVIPVANEARSTVRFRMDSREQIEAQQWIEANGLELVGIFHSHPAGPERPSETDIAEAAYPVVHLIWSRPEANWTVKGYWIEGGRVKEVGLDIAGGQ